MTSVHVLDDPGHRIGQRVRLRVTVLRGCNPGQHADAANVINVNDLHPVKGNIFEVCPIFAVCVAPAQALPAVPGLRTQAQRDLLHIGRGSTSKHVWADLKVYREERRKMLDSRGFLGQFLLGIILDFLT